MNEPSVMSVAHFSAIVEEYANGTIGELKSKSIFVGIIDPFSDEERSNAIDESGIVLCACGSNFGEARFDSAMHHEAVRFFVFRAQ